MKPGKEEKIGKKNLEKINRKLNKAVETNVEVYQMTTELAKKKKGGGGNHQKYQRTTF